MAALPELGPWAKEKLAALARRLGLRTRAFKRQPKPAIYLDARAGGDQTPIRTAER